MAGRIMIEGLGIQRSSGQALYRYLPECIVEACGGKVITKVLRWMGDPIKPQGAERVLEEIYEYYFPQYEKIDRRFPQPLPKNSKFEFYSPRYIHLELFPLTFQDKTTTICREFVRIDELKNFLRAEAKNKTAANWNQIDLVYVNMKTGSVKSFHVIPCKEHKSNKNMLLDRAGKYSQRDWRWRCSVCHKEYPVVGYVDGDMITKAEPVRSPLVFQPQIISVVNVRDYSKSKCGKEKAAEVILANYLSILGGNLQELLEEAGKLKKSGPSPDEIRKTLNKLKLTGNFTEAQMEILEKELPTRSTRDDSGNIDSATKQVSDILRGVDLQRISYRIYEYLETLSEETRITLDSYMSLDKRHEEQMRIFKDKLSSIGVSESYALQKVPLMQVAYGYTRGSLDPSDCVLKAFPPYDNTKDSETIPLYANEMETEALVFEFSRNKVAQWLEANGVITNWNIAAEDKLKAKMWFLSNIDTKRITRWEGASIGSEDIEKASITNHVFKLIHSISHALIKQIPSHAGISSESIGEIIFPNIPAVMIFSNSQGGFNLGELHELYQNSIYPWVDHIKESARNGGCVYDPICFDGDASCHHCMLAHEVTCAHFNKDLGRDYLFSGGKGKIKIGFWDFIRKSGD